MISDKAKGILRQTESLCRVLWFSFMGTFVALGAIAQLLPPRTEVRSDGDILFYAFMAMSVTTALLSLVLPKIFLTDDKLRKVFRDNPDQEPTRPSVRGLYSTCLILQLALNETIAIFGFLLAFLGTPFDIAVGFIIVAAVIHVMCFPRIEPLMERIENYDVR